MVWELLVKVENGEAVERAELAALSDEDRAIFTEEYDIIMRKLLAAPVKEPARQAVRCAAPAGFDYENAILARQERAF